MCVCLFVCLFVIHLTPTIFLSFCFLPFLFPKSTISFHPHTQPFSLSSQTYSFTHTFPSLLLYPILTSFLSLPYSFPLLHLRNHLPLSLSSLHLLQHHITFLLSPLLPTFLLFLPSFLPSSPHPLPSFLPSFLPSSPSFLPSFQHCAKHHKAETPSCGRLTEHSYGSVT